MNPQTSNTGHSDFLYETLERDVKELIETGALRPGDRVPSLRHMSKRVGVSLATVTQAYVRLERKGYIEARSRSGFYVCRRPEATLPRAKATKGTVSKVRVSDTVANILSAAHSPGVVSFGLANPSPELLPTKGLTRALNRVNRQHPLDGMRYTLPSGTEQLRRQISLRCADKGCTVSPDEVLITTGATEALAIALRAVAKSGDVVAVESPCYFQILELIERLGMLAIQIPTNSATGLDLNALEDTLERVAVKVVLCVPNFHNPLGSLMPDNHKQDLVAMLSEREIPLIEDDVYGDLYFDDVQPRLAKSYDTQGLVLTCSSVSKTIAPGYRIGWLLPGRYYTEACVIKRGTVGTTASLPQLAIAEFYASGQYDRHMRLVRRTYEEQVERVRFAIANCFPPTTRISKPRGGFVLWVEFPRRIDGDEFFSAAMKLGISVTPGSLFSAQRQYKNYARVSAGLAWNENVEKALLSLGQLAKDMA